MPDAVDRGVVRPTSPALAVAAAADPSPLRALLKSLSRSSRHTGKYAAQLMDLTPPVSLDVAADTRLSNATRTPPGLLSTRNRFRSRASCGPPTRCGRWPSPAVSPGPLAGAPVTRSDPAQLDAIAASVVAAGLEPVACDLTTADMADSRAGRDARRHPRPSPAVHGPPEPCARRAQSSPRCPPSLAAWVSRRLKATTHSPIRSPRGGAVAIDRVDEVLLDRGPT